VGNRDCRSEEKEKEVITKNVLIELIEYWAHEILDENHKRLTETHRWLFCYNGEEGYDSTCFDCACCLSDEVRREGTCGCICHERIDSLADYLEDKIADYLSLEQSED
jgi:hypothetical protein